jgi:hypothetical protein
MKTKKTNQNTPKKTPKKKKKKTIQNINRDKTYKIYTKYAKKNTMISKSTQWQGNSEKKFGKYYMLILSNTHTIATR